MFISNISTQQIYTQGTNITAALEIAEKGLIPSQNDTVIQTPTNKVIVVISDGEDHSEGAVDVAENIAKQDIKIFTIGVGSLKGETIPLSKGNHGQSVQRDRDGHVVISKLNEQMLKQIAKAGKGEYFHANDASVGFDMLATELDKIEKSNIDDVLSYHYQSKYYIPLWIAFVLLLLEILLRNKKMIQWNIFAWIKEKKLVWIVLFLSANVSLSAQIKDELKFLRQGNRQYQEAEKLRKEGYPLSTKENPTDTQKAKDLHIQASRWYENASTNYLKSHAANPNFYKANFNQAVVLYRQGKYEDAVKEITKIIENKKLSQDIKAKAYYNMGNVLMQQQQYQQAIDAYKNSLKCNPADADAKYNLVYAQKKLLATQQNTVNTQNQNSNQQQSQQQQQQSNREREQSGQDANEKQENHSEKQQPNNANSYQNSLQQAMQQGQSNAEKKSHSSQSNQHTLKQPPLDEQQQKQTQQYKKALDMAKKQLAEKEKSNPQPSHQEKKDSDRQKQSFSIQDSLSRQNRNLQDTINSFDQQHDQTMRKDSTSSRRSSVAKQATIRQLDALQQNEKQTQEKVSMKQSSQKQSVKQDKNW
jgi:Ca-activated chloride channel family protein